MRLMLIMGLAALLVLAACATERATDGNTTQPIVGGDRDAHGCIPSAGYTWCETKQKCLRPFEEQCNDTTQNATGLANPASVNCVNQGGTLEIRDTPQGQIGVCHVNGTECEEWALFRGEGCVAPNETVEADNGTALVGPTGFVACTPEQRNVGACTMDYTPVCAQVDNGIRCIKAPCPSTGNKTYSNACGACSDPNVIGYTPGACAEETTGGFNAS